MRLVDQQSKRPLPLRCNDIQMLSEPPSHHRLVAMVRYRRTRVATIRTISFAV